MNKRSQIKDAMPIVPGGKLASLASLALLPESQINQNLVPVPHFKDAKDANNATVEFTIPGDVVPWARAGSKGKIRFTPKKQSDYMAAVKLIGSAAMKGKPPLEGPIMLDITATYPWPAAMSQKKRTNPAAQWRTARPDLDNIGKLIGDALNRIAWADDSQIACSMLRKVYGEQPGLLVKFEEING